MSLIMNWLKKIYKKILKKEEWVEVGFQKKDKEETKKGEKEKKEEEE